MGICFYKVMSKLRGMVPVVLFSILMSLFYFNFGEEFVRYYNADRLNQLSFCMGSFVALCFVGLAIYLSFKNKYKNVFDFGVMAGFYLIAVSLVDLFYTQCFLFFQIYTVHSGMYYLYAVTFIGVLLYLYFIGKLCILNAKKFFICSFILLGGIYIGLCFPWLTSDAKYHFKAAYRYSNILLGYSEWAARFTDAEIWAKVHFDLTLNFMHYLAVFSNVEFFVRNDYIISFSYPIDFIKYYSFVCYIAPITGIVISRFLGFSGIFTAYFAKFVTYLFYLLFINRAIKNIPFNKAMLAFVSLLPVSLMLSSAIGYDVMVLITVFNFTAVVFKCYEDKNCSLLECGIWAFLIGAVKGGGYIILVPLVFILWSKERKWCVLGVVAVSLLSIWYFDVYLNRERHLFQFGDNNSINFSASFAFEHPFIYLKMLVNTFLIEGDKIFFGMLGSYLFRDEYTLPYYWMLCFLGVIFFCAMFGKSEIKLSKKMQVLIWGIIAVYCLTMPIMLLSFTVKESNYVIGINGRYYLPLLPLWFILLSANKGKFRKKIADKYGDVIEQYGYLYFAVFSLMAIVMIMDKFFSM